jgi:autotransporter-associated beta strand protein
MPMREQGRLRRNAAALAFGVVLAVAGPMTTVAEAQSFTWGGTGSSTTTSDYGTDTNWSNSGTAPPFLPTQSAIFGANGSSTVVVDLLHLPVPFFFQPDSWTFSATAQSVYSISGDAIGFNVAGPTGGIINNANAGQTITIANNINDGFNGSIVPVMVQQLGNSTLVLAGANSYSGGTLISAGTVQVTNANSLGTGTVFLNGGTLQMQSPTLTLVNFSNPFAVNAPGGTVDLNGAFVTLSGVISDGAGAGVLSVIDSSGSGATLELANANTYTGGTNANAVTLAVDNNSSVGTGTVTLNNAIFQANSPGNLTFANNFSLSGSNIFDANGVTLTIAGNINGAGSLEVANSGGSSGFAPGTVVMLGTNTYTGGTLICSCSTLQLGDPTHTASIIGAVDNEGIFNIVNANTSKITSITNDSGLTTFSNSTSASTIAITNQSGGETDFKDNSAAGSAVITNRGSGGFTTFSNAASAQNANITNQSGSSTVFLGNSSAGNAFITNKSGGGFFPDTLFGNLGGGIFLPGLGFFNNSTAANATIVNNGSNAVVAFGFPPGFGFLADTSTAGNANITNSNGGNLQFSSFTTAGNATITTLSGSGTAFFDNSTGGNARFITNGTGFVDFSSSIGPNSDNRITAGSIEGSGTYYIGAGNTLAVGSNNLSTTVSGKVADFDPCGCFGGPGPGSLEKVGTGTLTLSGANTYTGTTTVSGGVLDVEGSIASSVLTTVNAGGALTGAGTVGNTTIATGGIFLPGNGPPGSSTTVAGNLAFQSGTLYLVQLNSATSTFANVTGTATLAGTVGASFAPGSTVMKQYMILSFAGVRSGAFDGAGVIGASGGLVATVSYDPNHAYLNFALNFGATPGLNINQQKVGTALNNFFNTNGGIPAAFATLSPAGLTQVSGELATGTQQATFDAMNLFMGLLTDPFIDGRGNGVSGGPGATPFAAEDGSASAYAAKKTDAARDAFAKFPTKADAARNDPFDARWSVWGASYGGGSTTNGNAALGSNNSTTRAFGIVAGADYRISPVTLAGFALAGGGTNFSVNGAGTGRSDLFQAGVFVRHTVGSAYVTGAFAYGWQEVTTDRTVTTAGLGQLHAQFDANAFSGRLEGGNRYVMPWMGITPYAAGQFTTYSLPAYAEQALAGTGAFALNYAAKDVTDARTELGVRTDRSFAMQDGILTLRGRFAWAHDFDTDRNISAVFQTLPGASFVVSGAAQAHDSALITASLEKKWLNGWSVAATFEGEFSNLTNSYAGKGAVRYAW